MLFKKHNVTMYGNDEAFLAVFFIGVCTNVYVLNILKPSDTFKAFVCVKVSINGKLCVSSIFRIKSFNTNEM